jgi:hypothetical protein
MVKKKVKKKKASVKKAKKPKAVAHHLQRAPHEPKMEKVLVENFVSLQRVLTNLAVNVDNLSNRISKLLELFEISAKSLAEKDFEFQEDTAELVDKLDSLIDQNKVLARGMALMHERIPREQFPPPAPMPQPQMPPPMPPQLPPQTTQQAPAPGPTASYTKELPPMPPELPPMSQQAPIPPSPLESTKGTKGPKPTTGPKPASKFEPPLE